MLQLGQADEMAAGAKDPWGVSIVPATRAIAQASIAVGKTMPGGTSLVGHLVILAEICASRIPEVTSLFATYAYLNEDEALVAAIFLLKSIDEQAINFRNFILLGENF